MKAAADCAYQEHADEVLRPMKDVGVSDVVPHPRQRSLEEYVVVYDDNVAAAHVRRRRSRVTILVRCVSLAADSEQATAECGRRHQGRRGSGGKGAAHCGRF